MPREMLHQTGTDTKVQQVKQVADALGKVLEWIPIEVKNLQALPWPRVLESQTPLGSTAHQLEAPPRNGNLGDQVFGKLPSPTDTVPRINLVSGAAQRTTGWGVGNEL